MAALIPQLDNDFIFIWRSFLYAFCFLTMISYYEDTHTHTQTHTLIHTPIYPVGLRGHAFLTTSGPSCAKASQLVSWLPIHPRPIHLLHSGEHHHLRRTRPCCHLAQVLQRLPFGLRGRSQLLTGPNKTLAWPPLSHTPLAPTALLLRACPPLHLLRPPSDCTGGSLCLDITPLQTIPPTVHLWTQLLMFSLGAASRPLCLR